MPLTDLRQYIEALRELADLQEIDLPVALDLELAAITRRCYETGAPAPLFNAFSDHVGGMRLLGAPAGLSARPWQSLLRVATSLELPADSGGLEIVEAIAANLDRPSVAPTVVEDAPCFQNVAVGDDVDLMRLPLPRLQCGDDAGGLGVWGCLVARLPNGAWTHWSLAALRRLDSLRLAAFVPPEQPLATIARQWADVGQAMPFALALGTEPSVPFACGMCLPENVDTPAWLGALMRRPIRLVRCRTVPLEAPASSEVLIEGHMHMDEIVHEPAMATIAGHRPAPLPMRRSILRVDALAHRDDAVLPVVVAGEPVEDNHTAMGIPTAARLLHELRRAGIAVTAAWIPLQAALHWLVVTVPRDWRRRSDIDTTADLCRRIGEVVRVSRAGESIVQVIVLNDDVDPTDQNELIFAFATRCDPLLGDVTIGRLPMRGPPTCRRPGERVAAGTRIIVCNGLPPDQWGEAMPIRASFRYAYAPELVHRVLRRWTEYGFATQAVATSRAAPTETLAASAAHAHLPSPRKPMT